MNFEKPSLYATVGAIPALLGLSFAIFSASAVAVPPNPPILPPSCTAADCITYNIAATQDTCTEVSGGPSYDLRWVAGMSQEVDDIIKGGNIVAYKIQWFTGAWSGWYVPGVNDIDSKFNLSSRTLRRVWSYFYDHNHLYVICNKTPGAF
jgi:hypothetical protein